MTDINHAHIRRLDVTLLIVFLELMRHRKLTVVAERLGLTQSAISHSLKRLRDIFEDELFVRRPSGVEPTRRALALEPKLASIVALMDQALGVQEFDPAKDARIVTIAAIDNVASIYAGPIIDRFRTAAPSMQISFRPIARKEALAGLADGSVDLALGFFGAVPDQFDVAKLYTESYSVVARKGHAVTRGALTLKRYVACDHLLVSLSGDLTGIVDTTLAGMKLKRRVVAAVPLFLQALATVAETDLICTVPARLAQRHGGRFGLAVLKVPLLIRPFAVSAVWHRRTTSDPTLTWIRTQIMSVVR